MVKLQYDEGAEWKNSRGRDLFLRKLVSTGKQTHQHNNCQWETHVIIQGMARGEKNIPIKSIKTRLSQVEIVDTQILAVNFFLKKCF